MTFFHLLRRNYFVNILYIRYLRYSHKTGFKTAINLPFKRDYWFHGWPQESTYRKTMTRFIILIGIYLRIHKSYSYEHFRFIHRWLIVNTLSFVELLCDYAEKIVNYVLLASVVVDSIALRYASDMIDWVSTIE